MIYLNFRRIWEKLLFGIKLAIFEIFTKSKLGIYNRKIGISNSMKEYHWMCVFMAYANETKEKIRVLAQSYKDAFELEKLRKICIYQHTKSTTF